MHLIASSKHNNFYRVKGFLLRSNSFHKLFILFIWFFMIAAIAIYNISKVRLTGLFPSCLFLKETGLYCPGCGGTRAVQYLLKGDIIHSLRLNFIPFVIGVLLLLALLQFTLVTFLKIKIKIIVFKDWMLWAALIIIPAFWILRNVF